MKLLTSLLLALVVCACAPQTAQTAPPPFEDALRTHLAAIPARDIDAFRDTITTTDNLQVIFPNGQVLGSTAEVIAFHEDWFADPNWRWDGEVVRSSVGAEMAYALVRYDYRDTPDGDARPSWLVLIFQLESNEWRLIHDQNTPITEPADPA